MFLGFVDRIKAFLGVLLLDAPRYLMAIYNKISLWDNLCNRSETVIRNPDGRGVFCNWKWSSDLHAPTVIPSLGKRLMLRAFRDYPLLLSDQPGTGVISKQPQVSFIIGHRGKERLPHLLNTLKSIAAQTDVTIECIVVEQSTQPEVQEELPQWVRYIHAPSMTADAPYNRSQTLNVGAASANGKMLVLHDNDMIVPTCYASQVSKLFADGYEIINLKRFVFYLDRITTEAFFDCDIDSVGKAPEAIVQNLEGGGSLAVSRTALYELGGFDEDFVGWGGEDVEFWERALTQKVYRYPYLPFLHLWHAPQPGKTPAKQTNGMQRYIERSAIPPCERINELRVKNVKYYG